MKPSILFGLFYLIVYKRYVQSLVVYINREGQRISNNSDGVTGFKPCNTIVMGRKRMTPVVIPVLGYFLKINFRLVSTSRE